MSETLCIIAARGGSKGIFEKNLQYVGSKPLIDWVCDVALTSFSSSCIFLSTDCEKIAAHGKQKGINCNPLRPPQLATDKAKVVDVIDYTVELLEDKYNKQFVNVVLLQPTSPFVTSKQIRDSLKLLKDGSFTINILLNP